MPKAMPPVPALPSDLVPAKSSTQLIREHVERLRESGVPQKVIALSMGCTDHYISMLKKTTELPLSRVTAFAAAARLSDKERRELLHTRLMELNGGKSEVCIETLAQWADDVFTPIGDEAKLLELWKNATGAAPHLLVGLLQDPARAARLAAVMNEMAQAELKAQAEEAALP